jgi:DNA polymerase III subunit alpha
MAFVHLHVHSQFSLLDGAIPLKKLAPAAAALGQPAIALTDHCNLYGAVQFHKSCKDAGIKAILGSGLWVQPEGQAKKDPLGQKGGYHLVALVENDVGYKNLSKLITSAIFDGMYYKPRIDLELLREHHHGLVFLTSGMRGPVRQHLANGDIERAERFFTPLAEIVPASNLFLELQDVAFDGDQQANAGCRELAGKFGLHTVVTNNVHYLKPQDAPVLDLLQCIATSTSMNDERRRRPTTDQLYLKSEAEMRELFPNDLDAIDRTGLIAERCNYHFDYKTYYFPASTPPDTEEGADTQKNWDYFYEAFPPASDWPVPDKAPAGAGNLDGYFEWYAKEGLKLRLQRVDEDKHPAYWERLQIEFDIVESMGFPAYFLIVAEFINWAKDQDIPVGPGRGSAAGSLAAWAMRITDIDPLRFDLLFERFLNPERVSMPDVDIDFCQDRREEVIQHTREKYGTDYVAQIITYGKLQAKAAIRDVSRVNNMSFGDSDKIAKLIPNELGIKLVDALKEDGLNKLVQGNPAVRRIYGLAREVEGLTRQTGVHAAGVVIADRPLVELVPLYRDGPDGGPVVQFDMKSAEGIGLIKFDFLGLKTLDQIRDAVKLIERNTGEFIDMSDIPVDDKPTFELLCRGDGLGVFQVESSGMRELLTKLRPSTLDDVVALVALYRPGPLNSGMVDDFIDRKHGRKAVVYDLPELEPILNTTYGVVVYQEQVMKVAQVLASYSLGEADLLRRAMGKKKAEEMEKQKARFMQGAGDNGFDLKKAEAIFDLLAMFAAYGFNKSHSAAYGYISYQTAWLKANHRAEYMAALMSIESGNTDKILVYIGDCKRSGLTILPPDVNASFLAFDVPADARTTIRYGLGAIKGVGRGAVEALMEARKAAGGKFTGFMDCLEQLDFGSVNKKFLEALIKAGAFDFTGHERGRLFNGLEIAISYAQREQADKASGQVGLFGMLTGSSKPTFKLPEFTGWSEAQRLGYERDALGFFLSGHPVTTYKEVVDRIASARIAGLTGIANEAEVNICGMPASIKVVRTKRGDKMGFVGLDDETEQIECVFFADAWARSVRAMREGEPVLIRGKLEKGAEGMKILAESAELMREIRQRSTREVVLTVDYDEFKARGRIDALKKALEENTGACKAVISVTQPNHCIVRLELPLSLSVLPNETLQDAVDEVFRRRGVVSFR